MIKKLIKIFMPSSTTLAKYAAQGIANTVNSSDKKELIVKYGTMADEATSIQKWITEIVKDGTIDKIEEQQIAEKLIPLFEQLRKII